MYLYSQLINDKKMFASFYDAFNVSHAITPPPPPQTSRKIDNNELSLIMQLQKYSHFCCHNYILPASANR